MKCTEQMEYTLLTFVASCCKFKSVSHHFGIKEVQPQPSFSALRVTRAHELACLDFPHVTWAYTGQNTEDNRLEHQKELHTVHEISTWMASFIHLMTTIWCHFPFRVPVHREWMAHVHDLTITGDSSYQSRAGPNMKCATLYLAVHVGPNE